MRARGDIPPGSKKASSAHGVQMWYDHHDCYILRHILRCVEGLLTNSFFCTYVTKTLIRRIRTPLFFGNIRSLCFPFESFCCPPFRMFITCLADRNHACARELPWMIIPVLSIRNSTCRMCWELASPEMSRSPSFLRKRVPGRLIGCHSSDTSPSQAGQRLSCTSRSLCALAFPPQYWPHACAAR